MAVAKEHVPWTAGKVVKSVCRGEGKGSCVNEFEEKEEDWLAKLTGQGEQLCMPVWCKPCREERKRIRYSMVIEVVDSEAANAEGSESGSGSGSGSSGCQRFR